MALKLETMETKESGKFKKYYSFIMIPIVILIPIAFWIYMEKEGSYLIDNYRTIEKSTEINGRVTKVNLNRGLFAIDLSNGTRVKSMDDITNNKKHDIAFFLKEYDSVIKKANSDTVIVKRNRKPYYFVLRY
jgi:hypothetical protein